MEDCNILQNKVSQLEAALKEECTRNDELDADLNKLLSKAILLEEKAAKLQRALIILELHRQDRTKIREAVAAKVHDVWAKWMGWQSTHADLVPKAGIDATLNVEAVRRWERQRMTPYRELTPKEQASDMQIAEEYLKLILGEENENSKKG